MKTSSNYGLKLPEGTDNVKRQDFVDNFTKIDVTMKSIADSSFPLVNATGTNDYTGTNADIKSLNKGTKFTLFVDTDATGNCTLNLNSYGAKNIKDSFGNIVTNFKKDIPYNICFNGVDFILQGKGGGGNVQPSEVLNGKTFTNDKGPGVGTMPNNGAINATLNCGQSKVIPKGYTDGGIITTNSLASQTQATAQAGHMLSGVTAYVNGNKITGTIPSLTPTYADQRQALGITTGNHSGNGQINTYFQVPNGHFLSGVNWINFPTPYLQQQFIVSGANILGVPGSATVESLGGRRFASGVTTSEPYNYIPFQRRNGSFENKSYIAIRGLSFVPSIIIIWSNAGLCGATIYKADSFRENFYMIEMKLSTSSNYSNAYHYTNYGVKLSNSDYNVVASTGNLPHTWIAYS